MTWNEDENLFEITYREAGCEFEEKEELKSIGEEMDEIVKIGEVEAECTAGEGDKENVADKGEILRIELDEIEGSENEVAEEIEVDEPKVGQLLLEEEEVLEKRETEEVRDDVIATIVEGGIEKEDVEDKEMNDNAPEVIMNSELNEAIREKENENASLEEGIEELEIKTKGIERTDQFQLNEGKHDQDGINIMEKTANVEEEEKEIVAIDEVRNTQTTDDKTEEVDFESHEAENVHKELSLSYEDDTTECLHPEQTKKMELKESEPMKDREVCTIIVKFEPDATLDGWPTVVPDQPPMQPLDPRRRVGGKYLMTSAGMW